MRESWQRFEAVLRGQAPDRVPLTQTWGPHGPQWRRLLGREPAGDADLLAYKLALDLPIGLRIARVWNPFGSDWQTASDGTDHYVQGHLQPGASLAPYADTDDLAAFAPRARAAVRASHEAGLAAEGVVMSCIHACSTAMGLEGLAIAAYEQPDWLADAMELVETYNRRTVAVLIDAGVDLVLFDGDCAYKQGLMLSPAMMRRFWFERTRRTVDLLHEAGVWAYYHTDGKVDEVLPMLIELGFAAFHGCEKAANDLGHLKRAFGDRITLIGNADQVELTRGPVDRIVAETRRMLAIGAPGGRFVADVNTSVHECIPVEHYEAFVETVRREG